MMIRKLALSDGNSSDEDQPKEKDCEEYLYLKVILSIFKSSYSRLSAPSSSSDGFDNSEDDEDNLLFGEVQY